MVAAVARAPRLSPASRFSELVDGWLFQLGATKPAAPTPWPPTGGTWRDRSARHDGGP